MFGRGDTEELVSEVVLGCLVSCHMKTLDVVNGLSVGIHIVIELVYLLTRSLYIKQPDSFPVLSFPSGFVNLSYEVFRQFSDHI